MLPSETLSTKSAERERCEIDPGCPSPVSLAVHFRSHPSHTYFGSAFPLEPTHMPSYVGVTYPCDTTVCLLKSISSA